MATESQIFRPLLGRTLRGMSRVRVESPDCPCACGTAVQALGSIMGRVIERFTLPDGRRLHPLALVIPLMRSMDWMRRYQLIQEEVCRIRVKLLVYRQPNEDEVASARRLLQSVAGDEVDFVIEIVDRIDPHPSGKMRPYFSLLPADPHDVGIGLTGRRSSTDGSYLNDSWSEPGPYREASVDSG